MARTGNLPTPSSHTKGQRRMRPALGNETLLIFQQSSLSCPSMPTPTQGRAEKKPNTLLHKNGGQCLKGERRRGKKEGVKRKRILQIWEILLSINLDCIIPEH